MTAEKRDPFIVLSLPRSRSAWAAHLLSYPGRLVGHDIAVECDSMDAFVKSYGYGMDGSCETAAMIGWRLLRHQLPKLKTLVVFREVNEVISSLGRLGVSGPQLDYEMKSRFYVLEAISSCPGVKAMYWSDWSSIGMAAEAWEWLLDLPFDPDWWADCCAQKIEINWPQRQARLWQRREQIATLKREILSRQLAIGMSGCPVFN